MKRIALTYWVFLILIKFSLNAQPVKQLNSAEIYHELQKLNTCGSVLYIAAHPDDENTRLLAWLANEKHLRTGYLALTRGDGGQNLIGSEQGELLGLIRTQELLAARKIDGAEQFFSRAYDFGFSKNPEETLRFWNKDSILSDIVWVIRLFQPDVIITRFPDDGTGGHGHHTASALLAEEAFNAAADPNRFPEQFKYGVKPWQARSLYWNSWGRRWNPDAEIKGLLKLDVGQFNSLLGKGYGEMAAEGRSMHKSQGFGSASVRGEMDEYFKYLKGDSFQNTLFENIDLNWSRVNGGEKIGEEIKKALSNFDFKQPEKILPNLEQIHKLLAGRTDHYSLIKKAEVEELILQVTGTYIELLASEPITTKGETNKIISNIWIRHNGIQAGLTMLNIPYSLSFNGPVSTQIRLLQPWDRNEIKKSISKINLPEQQYFVSDTLFANIPDNFPFTNQYWLRNPHGLGRFTVNHQNLIGQAENVNPISATIYFKAGTEVFSVNRPVLYKWVDPVKGEKFRNLEILPEISIEPEDSVVMIVNNAGKIINIHFVAEKDSVDAKITLEMTNAWEYYPTQSHLQLSQKGDEKVLQFEINPLAKIPDNTELKIIAQTATQTDTFKVQHIIHDHIPIQVEIKPDDVKIVPVNLKIGGKRIGYIPGAGDDVPKCLQNVGYEVDILNEEQLEKTDLQKYDAIITGVRAYNVNPFMPKYYTKLMNYISNGGTMLVQYNTVNNISKVTGEMGPYPFKITKTRVTDELADISITDSNDMILNYPNKITQSDFDGWVQERGIYFASQIDSNYRTPFVMNDQGETPSNGSLLIAHYGKGYFIYSGIVFFRELPAGVPGAYRLIANLLAL
jgi:LmbE family N-acetylglucosaminyl deacetylase